MLEKLDALKKRYEQLQELLVDPVVIADRPRYQKCAKEMASISDVVKKYSEYQKACLHFAEVELILKDKGQSNEMLELANEELAELQKTKDLYQRQLQDILLTGQDRGSDKNIIMEIRAGTGGREASLFASELYRMYARYAANKGWAVDVINTSISEAGGFKEIIFSVEGGGVYKRLRYESGVHRVQRVPVTEAQGRIHTSAVSVVVLPEVEEIELNIDPKDLKIDVFRATGPGGQGVNTTDSAVRITHLPTNTVVSCQDERSQLKNKAKAMKVLRARIMDNIARQQTDKIARERRVQIGTGDRSEKIRTYNFPDRRVTDHRIGFALHRLPEILEGDLDELINALLEIEKAQRLKNK